MFERLSSNRCAVTTISGAVAASAGSAPALEWMRTRLNDAATPGAAARKENLDMGTTPQKLKGG
jgi:hypothetical protein